jgi:hypothetical protein
MVITSSSPSKLKDNPFTNFVKQKMHEIVIFFYAEGHKNIIQTKTSSWTWENH